ncbi:MAG: DUF1015 domain-containing protein, partial [Actinobacteria bacterium]|nr:DUF1015 domain-containing protein [Actinomycetota bacterium]
MVDILPLNGLIYNPEKISKYSEVLAPPYDIISSSLKEDLKKQSPYNIVALTLPDETSTMNKYENSKATFSRWIKEEILKYDLKKCFYLFEETFIENGITKSFKGFIGLLKVEEYGAGKVLRHEKTLSKPKEDRLALLKVCRANLEFIYTIYNDDDSSMAATLNNSFKDKPNISTVVKYDSSLHFRFWKISETDIIEKIKNIMKSKTLLIADGHHRYETSRLYKENKYILALFVSGNQKNILIHPTHRIIKFINAVKPEEIIRKIEKYFVVEKIKPDIADIKNKMIKSSSTQKKSLCIYFKNKDCYFITLEADLKRLYKKLNIIKEHFSTDYEYLDVNILHRLIIEIILADSAVKEINFVHSIEEVLKLIDKNDVNSDFDAGFILNAPTIETVEKLSYTGQIMPQKSTYFYPKPCSLF